MTNPSERVEIESHHYYTAVRNLYILATIYYLIRTALTIWAFTRTHIKQEKTPNKQQRNNIVVFHGAVGGGNHLPSGNPNASLPCPFP